MSSHFDDCDGSCVDGQGSAPGADDNASAVAAVLEAARLMAQTQFHGTIVFACFDGEELGLWGSAHYASELAARHAPVLAVLNNDIIGETAGGDGAAEPHVVRVFSEAIPANADRAGVNATGSESDSPSRELARFVGETVPVYVPDFAVRQIFRADRFLRGGDQESFQDAGFAAIRFVESHENFERQHQNVRTENGIVYGDLPQYIDPAYLARVDCGERRLAGRAGAGPRAPGRRPHGHQASGLRYRASLGDRPERGLVRDPGAVHGCSAMAERRQRGQRHRLHGAAEQGRLRLRRPRRGRSGSAKPRRLSHSDQGVIDRVERLVHVPLAVGRREKHHFVR